MPDMLPEKAGLSLCIRNTFLEVQVDTEEWVPITPEHGRGRLLSASCPASQMGKLLGNSFEDSSTQDEEVSDDVDIPATPTKSSCGDLEQMCDGTNTPSPPWPWCSKRIAAPSMPAPPMAPLVSVSMEASLSLMQYEVQVGHDSKGWDGCTQPFAHQGHLSAPGNWAGWMQPAMFHEGIHMQPPPVLASTPQRPPLLATGNAHGRFGYPLHAASHADDLKAKSLVVGKTLRREAAELNQISHAQKMVPRTAARDDLPSLGSGGHGTGKCKPCAFLHTRGCDNGSACQFCHLCEPGEKKRRQKAKVATMKAKIALRAKKVATVS